MKRISVGLRQLQRNICLAVVGLVVFCLLALALEKGAAAASVNEPASTHTGHDDAARDLRVTRLRIYFDKHRPEITVRRNQGIKAYAPCNCERKKAGNPCPAGYHVKWGGCADCVQSGDLLSTTKSTGECAGCSFQCIPNKAAANVDCKQYDKDGKTFKLAADWCAIGCYEAPIIK